MCCKKGLDGYPAIFFSLTELWHFFTTYLPGWCSRIIFLVYDTWVIIANSQAACTIHLACTCWFCIDDYSQQMFLRSNQLGSMNYFGATTEFRIDRLIQYWHRLLLARLKCRRYFCVHPIIIFFALAKLSPHVLVLSLKKLLIRFSVFETACGF